MGTFVFAILLVSFFLCPELAFYSWSDSYISLEWCSLTWACKNVENVRSPESAILSDGLHLESNPGYCLLIRLGDQGAQLEPHHYGYWQVVPRRWHCCGRSCTFGMSLCSLTSFPSFASFPWISSHLLALQSNSRVLTNPAVLQVAGENLAYTIHFYANTHKQELQSWARKCQDRLTAGSDQSQCFCWISWAVPPA